MSSGELLRLLTASSFGSPSVLLEPAQSSQGFDSHIIPKRIFQTLNRKTNLPPRIHGVIQMWRDLNPEYLHELYDVSDMRGMVSREFDRTFSKIFDSLGQYQQRSDLWRLCALFLHGGVYVDADYAPVSPLRDFLLQPGVELAVPLCAPLVVDPMQPPVGCHTRPESMKRLQNGFFAAIPRRPLLLLALQRLRWSFFRRADQHYLAAMGPALLYDAYSTLYGDPLAEVIMGPREHGVLVAGDVAPFLGRRHHPEVLLLVEADSVVASVTNEGPVPRMMHKYHGWAEDIALMRDDSATWVTQSGKCLLGFR